MRFGPGEAMRCSTERLRPPACRARDVTASEPAHDTTGRGEPTISEWLNTAVYGWYPYVALTVFLLGSLLRFDPAQYTWRSGSSQLLRQATD